MNPELTPKEHELNLLRDILNNLQKCKIDRGLNNANNYAGVAIENAIFNLFRIIILIEDNWKPWLD